MGIWSEYPRMLMAYDKNVNSRIDSDEVQQAAKDWKNGKITGDVAQAIYSAYANEYGLYALPEITEHSSSLYEAQPGEAFAVTTKFKNTDTKKGCLRDNLPNVAFETTTFGRQFWKVSPGEETGMLTHTRMDFDIVNERGRALFTSTVWPAIDHYLQTQDGYPKRDTLAVKMLPLTSIETTKAPDRVRPGQTFNIGVTVRNAGWAGLVALTYTELNTMKVNTYSFHIDTKDSRDINVETTMLPLHNCRYKLFSETYARTRPGNWLTDDESPELIVKPKMCILVFSEDKSLTIYGDEGGLGFKGFVSGRGIEGFDLPPVGGPFKGQAGLEGKPLSWESLSYLRIEFERGVAVGEDGELVQRHATSYQIGPVLPGTEASWMAFTRPVRKMLAFEPPARPLARFH